MSDSKFLYGRLASRFDLLPTSVLVCEKANSKNSAVISVVRVGLDVIVMVTVVELVCIDDLGMTSAFRVAVEAGVRL